MSVTLPYPDMDFVPLDILTAQEQDQLVANIEYLASLFPIGSTNIENNSITTAKINDNAVTLNKLDLSSIITSDVTLNTSGYSNPVTFNSGTAFRIGNICFLRLSFSTSSQWSSGNVTLGKLSPLPLYDGSSLTNGQPAPICVCYSSGSSTTYNIRGWVNSSGEIILAKPTIPSGAVFSIFLVYRTNS